MGAAVAAKIAEGVVNRSDLFITSKLWNTFHKPELVEGALKRSLTNLGLEYLDLYLIHWPVAYKVQKIKEVKGLLNHFLFQIWPAIVYVVAEF